MSLQQRIADRKDVGRADRLSELHRLAAPAAKELLRFRTHRPCVDEARMRTQLIERNRHPVAPDITGARHRQIDVSPAAHADEPGERRHARQRRHLAETLLDVRRLKAAQNLDRDSGMHGIETLQNPSEPPRREARRARQADAALQGLGVLHEDSTKDSWARRIGRIRFRAVFPASVSVSGLAACRMSSHPRLFSRAAIARETLETSTSSTFAAPERPRLAKTTKARQALRSSIRDIRSSEVLPAANRRQPVFLMQRSPQPPRFSSRFSRSF